MSDTLTCMPGQGIKIRCANRYWARLVQIVLRDTIGAQWATAQGWGVEIPWSTFRLWLVVSWGKNARWNIQWVSERDFDSVNFPEWDARALILARPGSPGWTVRSTAYAHHVAKMPPLARSTIWARCKKDGHIRYWTSQKRAQAHADSLNLKGIQ